MPLAELMEALVEVTACLPVYRTYIRDFEISDGDRRYIERTSGWRARAPRRDRQRRGLRISPPRAAAGTAVLRAEQTDSMLRFVMRWQQFTGPVMAKGLEDTASYRYNRLLSLNEVGGDPCA